MSKIVNMIFGHFQICSIHLWHCLTKYNASTRVYLPINSFIRILHSIIVSGGGF